jgi:Protein of unknown function (DUF3035)
MTVQQKLAPVSGRALIVLAAGSLALAGCAGVKQSLGAAKQSPDETAITPGAPLVVPATFELRAPQPGAPRPQDANAAAAAQKLLGGPAKQTPASQGEQAFLSASGATKADPTVRQELRNEVREAGKRKSYADSVLFWRGHKGDPGTPIDPNKEADRLNTAAPSQPVEAVIEKGETTVQPAAKDTKKKKSGGWFDWF